MLTIFQSNKSSQLLNELALELVKNKPEHILESQSILVQSPGMAQWVKLELAKQIGIAANLDFPLPASFLWNIYRAVLGEENVPEPIAYSKPVLQFLVMKILPDLLNEESFASLKSYLEGKTLAIKVWQLAGQIADAYDHYLVYRPDWLLDWEAGGYMACESQPWQAEMWRELVRCSRELPKTAKHRSEINNQCLTQLVSGNIASPELLPKNLYIYGISSLPSQYLKLFVALAEKINIVVFQLNPSCHYWGDIEGEKQQARKFVKALAQQKKLENLEDGHLMIGNPLLASFGKQGREWLNLLLDIPTANFKESYDELPEPECMLSAIQYEMYNLLYAGQIEPFWMGREIQSPYKFSDVDQSIEFHSCYTEQREVEVLHDWLLHQIKNKQLKPSDVIVMIPDINRYAPYIDAVFLRGNQDSSAYGENQIPYTLSDRSFSEELPLLNSLLFLLNWPQARKTSQEVVDFISMPAVARKFAITSEDIATIQEAIIQTGIRWGRNSDRAQWGLPDEELNSWEFGIRRMMLGYAMEESAGLYEGMKPLDLMQGDAINALTNLMIVIDKLDAIKHCLSNGFTLSHWSDFLTEMLKEFFELDEREQLAIGQLQKVLSDRVEQSEAAGFEQIIEPEVFVDLISELMSGKNDSFRFLDGGVTFCSLMPMRCIPFKYVCLIGMNEADFPRQVSPNVFDLTHDDLNAYRWGDRDTKADDRYQFLDALMAAQEKLYISYIGVSRRNNEILPASILVEELKEYLSVLKGDEVKPIQHSLQAFDVKNFIADAELKSFEKLWLPENSENQKAKKDLVVEFEIPEKISLFKIKKFYENPQKAFYAQAGVDFSLYHINLEEDETFKANGLVRWQHNQQAFIAKKNQLDFDQWQEEVYASGNAVSGLLAQREAWETWNRAENFYSAVHKSLDTELDLIEISLELLCNGQGVQLVENLYVKIDEQSNKVVKSHSNVMYMQRDTIKLIFNCWLDHLAVCANGFFHQTNLFCFNDEAVIYKYLPIDRTQAKNLLEVLLEHYIQGMQEQSLLVMNLAWQYALLLAHWLSENPAGSASSFPYHEFYKDLESAWQAYGVSDDEYIEKLLSYEEDFIDIVENSVFQRLVVSIMLPLVEQITVELAQESST